MQCDSNLVPGKKVPPTEGSNFSQCQLVSVACRHGPTPLTLNIISNKWCQTVQPEISFNWNIDQSYLVAKKFIQEHGLFNHAHLHHSVLKINISSIFLPSILFISPTSLGYIAQTWYQISRVCAWKRETKWALNVIMNIRCAGRVHMHAYTDRNPWQRLVCKQTR